MAGVSRPTVYNFPDAMDLIQNESSDKNSAQGKSLTQINNELKNRIRELEAERDLLLCRLMEKEDENIRLLNRLNNA